MADQVQTRDRPKVGDEKRSLHQALEIDIDRVGQALAVGIDDEHLPPWTRTDSPT